MIEILEKTLRLSHSFMPFITEEIWQNFRDLHQSKNESLDIETSQLFVKEIRVDSAGMLKRIRTAPQGRAHRIRKRSNHVTLILSSKTIS